MKNFTTKHFNVQVGKVWMVAIVFLVSGLFTYSFSQCTADAQSISGTAFLDQDNDGAFANEAGVEDVMVTVFNGADTQVAAMRTDENGVYRFDGLTDGQKYKLVFRNVDDSLEDGNIGTDNASSVQFIEAPACQVNYGLKQKVSGCGLESQIAFTCFVQGDVTTNSNMPTIVGTNYGFSEGSDVKMYANHGETGSVWGMAWKNSTQQLFSAAFVKQFAGLKSTPYSIYLTDIENGGTTKFVDLADLGVTTRALQNTDIMDCSYGRQVGRYGLGGMTMSADEKYIYTTVLNSNQVVAVDTEDPKASTTTIYDVPRPNGLDDGKEFRVFAITQYNNDIYVGVTVTGAKDKKESASRAVVMKLDPRTGGFQEVFTTNYTKGYWQDEFTAPSFPTHWLTDIAFTDDGNMILSLSDRAGHRFCKESGQSRLDVQSPDILLVGYDEATDSWSLESNGSVAGLTGSGVGNGQGPGGGEFFGYDYFPGDPAYHPEVALGSVMVMPGTNSVVATVYDPLHNTYSGGIHRYSTVDGKLLGAKEFYTDNIDVAFGKASGFGDLVSLCGKEKVQLGNYVWVDTDEDGIQDAGESPVVGATMELYNTNCELVATTTTDANGQYLFDRNIITDTDYFIVVGSNLYDGNTGLYAYGGSSNLSLTAAQAGASNQDSNADMDVSCLEQSAIPVRVDGNDFTFDVGLVESDDFDLALTKELLGSPFVSRGQKVTFEIKVYNQGAIAANNITITDYIPNGYRFVAADNTDWDYSASKATYTIKDPILSGKTGKAYITLVVDGSTYDQFVNVAEISSAEDTDGNPREDIDSTADDIKDNDKGGDVDGDTDNLIDDDGSIDEDDQDPATIKIFDLALKIELNKSKTYFNGDIVEATITVFNQGKVDAASFTVANYVPGGLTFQVDDNPEWSYNGGLLEFTDNEVLAAGTSRTYPVKFRVGKFFDGESLVNYAEITRSIPVGGEDSVDFDSTPDNVRDNDAGGQPESVVDNVVLADPSDDEDDHDPILIRTKFFDLALIKQVDKRAVSKDDQVTFNITVVNQGTAAVDKVTIIDYVPEGLVVVDDAWKAVGGGSYTREIELEQLLERGDSFETSIVTQVVSEKKGERIINYAEILAFELAGEIMTEKDVDSKADDIKDNDAGGEVSSTTDDSIGQAPTQDEDDHDPAALVIIDTEVSTECLMNATTMSDGQFEDTFTITSVSGSTWYIQEVQNYYEVGSPAPPGDPTLITNTGPGGETMTETDLGGGVSEYTYTAKKVDGEIAFITFRNEADDLESFNPPVAKYKDLNVSGVRGVCDKGIETYTIENASGSEMYTWTVTGGTIVGDDTGDSVDIDWSGAADDSVYEITIEADGCTSPTVVEVTTTSFTGSMYCKSEVNLSLDASCERQVEPGDIYTGSEDASEFVVMLTDENGEVIPNATLTSEHLGQRVEAKVIAACGANACWGYINVEDKVKPTLLCTEEIELFCHQLDEYEGPFASDNCSNPTVMLQTDGVPEILYCDDDYTMSITKRYIAVDDYGNESEPCEVTINLLRIDLDSIVAPEDRTMMMGNPVDCVGYETNDEGFPAISETGSPLYMDLPLLPDFVGTMCNLSVAYEDNLISDIDGVKKIERTFWIMETHCTSPMRTIVQNIDIVDTTPPTITCPDDITVSASILECSAEVELPLPEVSDLCSDNLTVTISSDLGFIQDGEDRTVVLAYKETPYVFTYRVTDEAGLTAECEMEVTVVDKTPPVVICDSDPTITIGGNDANDEGEAYFSAIDLDDGTYDYCMLDRLEIARMDANPACDPNGEVFSDRIKVCCSDVGQNVMVILRAYDVAGNYNECMVELRVDDKTAPTLTAPLDETIECGDDYLPLSQYGEPDVFDVCGATVTVDSIINLNSCGVGTIRRIFTATDGVNSVTDEQVITVVNSTPFDPGTIVWPQDYVSTGVCDADLLTPDLLPEANSYPTWTSDACDDVLYSYTDTPFTYDPNDLDNRDNCYTILRKWKVIDWCQADDPDYVLAVHDQMIKVLNSVAPEVTKAEIGNVVTADCDEAPVTFSATASDDCTPDAGLTWIVKIDYDEDGFADGNYDEEITGSGASVTLMRTVPLGSHFVSYTFYDACNNPTTVNDFFTVATNKGPSAVCWDMVTELQPMDLDGDGVPDSEMSVLCVDSLGNKSYHTCDIEFELSFDPDEIVKKDTVDCDDLGDYMVSVYVIDVFGNIDECVATVDVQDNNDVDICVNLEDCIVCPEDVDETADTNCSFTISNGDFDVVLSQQGMDGECGPLTFTHDYASAPDNTTLQGATFDVGVTVVTWTIMGTNGRTVTCTQNVTITDETDPTINCPDDVTVSSGDDGSSDCTYENGTLADATADDNCTIASLTHDYAGTTDNTTLAGASFPVGTTTVTWTATDDSGNTSTCTVSITVTDNIGPALTCVDDLTVMTEDIDMNVCSYTVSDGSLNPTADEECSTVVSLTNDVNTNDPSTLDGYVFPKGTTTVTWTATDDSGNTSTCTFDVTVVDNTSPVVTNCGTPTYTINDNDDGTLDCTGTISGVNPTATDNCDDNVTLEYSYMDENGVTVTGTDLDGTTFPVGTTTITWTATDADNNSTACSFDVVVEDTNIAACETQGPFDVVIPMDMMLVIDETILTTTYTDECGDITYSFTDNEFDCDDVGTTQTVTYTITDPNGNSSTCTFDVNIVNPTPDCIAMDTIVNLGPDGSITITPEMVVDASNLSPCGDNLEVTLSEDTFLCNDRGENTVTITVSYGNVSQTCDATVTIVDTLYSPMIECTNDIMMTCDDFWDNHNGDAADLLADSTFNYVVTSCQELPDNPYNVVFDTINGLNDCGYGIITRTVTVTDTISGISDNCTQIITITNDNPLTQDFVDGLPLPDTSFVMTCLDTTSIEPNDDIGIIQESDFSSFEPCGNISVNFEDVHMNNGNMCQDTIVRTYTVVDSCQLSTVDPAAGIFTTSHVIVVSDNTPPMLTVSLDTSYVSTENCMDEFDYSGSVTVTDCNDVTVEIANPIDSTDTDGIGSLIVGDNDIVYTATDACGNSVDTTINVFLKPSELALLCNKLAIGLEEEPDGTIDTVVHVQDHISWVIDSTCVDYSNFDFSYSIDDIDDDLRTYTCDDVTDDEVGFFIYIFYKGEFVDSCKTVVFVTDPDLVCPGAGGIVEGGITGIDGMPHSGYTVELQGSEKSDRTTDEEGAYKFSNVTRDLSYTVNAYRDDNHSNGVTAIDLVVMQRHILGIDYIDNPYLQVAADVNNDGSITPVDLFETRKVILRLQNEFSNNVSWRAISSDVNLDHPEGPWQYPFLDGYDIANLDGRETVNFIGFKVGDINMSSGLTADEGMIRNTQSLIGQDMKVNKGSEFASEFSVDAAQDIYGLQFGIKTQGVAITDISSDLINDEFISFSQVRDDEYIVMIASPQSISLSPQDVVFTVHGISEVSGSLAEAIQVNDRITDNEWIATLEASNPAITLRWGEAQDVESYAISQNTPNPWVDNTSITLKVPSADVVTLYVRDLEGKVIYSSEKYFEVGEHVITLSDEQIDHPGVYHVEVIHGSEIQRIKMIKIK